MPIGRWVNIVRPHMAAPFPRWANTFTALVLLAVLLGAVGGPAFLLAYMRTPYITGQWLQVSQPVEFDHRHHVRDDAIDCRYCHYTVEHSPSAGIPPVEVCMNCHNQVWNSSPLLAPVRDAYFAGTPLRWNRVHNLPDHVFFDHSIHVNKGIGCVSCHGRVDLMAYVYQDVPLTMAWCLECHRAPEAHLRPLEEVTSMEWTPTGDAAALRRTLAEEYRVRRLTHCSTCHR